MDSKRLWGACVGLSLLASLCVTATPASAQLGDDLNIYTTAYDECAASPTFLGHASLFDCAQIVYNQLLIAKEFGDNPPPSPGPLPPGVPICYGVSRLIPPCNK